MGIKKAGLVNKACVMSLLVAITLSLSGCAFVDSKVNDLTGDITGNTYTCSFYDNSGNKFMTAHGTNINITSNKTDEITYTDSGWEHTPTLSSVITINIDGKQVQSCGSTVIFAENGLNPDVDFKSTDINSEADGVTDMTLVSAIVNKYKNLFGKKSVVVIQSQLGDPIEAFSGDSVYWEVSDDLPKTTKLSIDGKSLYIHRANFQIIDKDLLD